MRSVDALSEALRSRGQSATMPAYTPREEVLQPLAVPDAMQTLASTVHRDDHARQVCRHADLDDRARRRCHRGGDAGIGVGALLGLRAGSLNEDSKANCNADQARCNADGIDQIDRAKAMARGATIGFVAGSVFVAGGEVLFLTAKSGDAKSAKRTVVVPTADANGGGVFVSGSF